MSEHSLRRPERNVILSSIVALLFFLAVMVFLRRRNG